MIKEDLYDAIFKRKSIRKFDPKPLSTEILKQVTDNVKIITPLYTDIKTEIFIASPDDVKLLMSMKAPHYLMFYSENKDGYLTNAGYMIQQLDLYLSSIGIGSCYVGMGYPLEKSKAGLEYVMMLAFGNPVESLYRESISEFKRRGLSEITDIKDNVFLEASRLAPSASNTQPWFFTGSNEIVHAFCIKPNIIKALLYEKMNKIDMGIALCHLAVSATKEDKKATFFDDVYASKKPPKGYYYINSIKISKD